MEFRRPSLLLCTSQSPQVQAVVTSGVIIYGSFWLEVLRFGLALYPYITAPLSDTPVLHTKGEVVFL